MLRLHTFFRKFAASIAVFLAVASVPHSGHLAIGVAQANSSSIEQHVASPAPLQAQAQSEGGILQSVLNLMARRSLVAAGWTVSSVVGAIDNASLRRTESAITGSGSWRIDVLDEQHQPVSLEGSLGFDLEGQAQSSQGFAVISHLSVLADATATLKGELHSTGIDVDLETDIKLVRNGDTLDQGMDISLHIVHEGKETQVEARSTGAVHSLAYNLEQSESHVTMDRDGKRVEATRIATVSNLGKGESEVSVESSAGDPSKPDVRASTKQHFFQRIVGNDVAQYVDQLTLTTPSNTYTLKEPGIAAGTLWSDLGYKLVLLDKDQNPLELNSGGMRGGEHARATGGPVATLASSKGGVISERLGNVVAQGDTVPCPSCESFARNAGVVIVGLGVGVLIGGPIIGAAAAMALADAGAGALLGEVGLGLGLASVTTGAITLGGVTGLGARNGDPFFIAPDTGLRLDAITPGPVQITRTSGGLTSSIIASAAALTPTEATTSTLQPDENAQYDDDPMPFVGGSLPPEAQPKGEWTWDETHSYGAIPAHTQTQTDSPQIHYFIHASTPLMLGSDSNLIQYVYLDPQSPPREIYLQFYTGNGDGEHRVYWGDDLVQTGGERGKASLYPMGSLPRAGGWVRLQIPADKLGLVDSPVNGILYGAYSGKTWWGLTTTSNRLTDNAPDQIAVQPPQTVPSTTHGSQIAFRLTEPQRLSVEIVDAQGKKVRALANEEERQAGYQVVVWDAKDDGGQDVPDVPYKVRFSIGGNVVAEHQVTIAPLVADIVVPGPYSLVRGNQVPVVAEAYGQDFASYKLEYGKGLDPSSWETIAESNAPALLPNHQQIRTFNPGNIANWNVGVDEFHPWNSAGLSGVYALRLTVTGKDGREEIDSFPVVVGRLAHTAEGGKITSPDGKASLTIPQLATEEPFTLMGLVPLPELEPDGGWKQNLPTGSKLLGEVYEVLPPNETFRQPATLELPYSGSDPPERVVILLGDGTHDGWHYIGGKADPTKGIVSVSLTGFGGGRALVAPFASGNFGQPPTDPAAGARLSLDPTNLAPSVQPGGAVGIYADLESSAGEYEALDVYGTRLERVVGSDAGTSAAGHALKVTRLPDGERLLRVLSTPYDTTKYPLLSFDYRLPTDYAPDIFVRSNGKWWQLQAGTNDAVTSSYFVPTLVSEKLVADDKWHHYQVDLFALLKYSQPDATGFQVDEIVLGQMHQIAYMQVEIRDSGEVGGAYYLANFAALSPTNATKLSFTWTPPPGVTFAGYAFALDGKGDTDPAEREQTTGTSTTIDVPPAAPDGALYFHLTGRGADGRWSTTTHVPVLLDRQPPRVGAPDPPPGGAGSPDFIVVPVVDETSGVAPASLKVKLNGQTYGIGKGLAYDPQLGVMTFSPGQVDPTAAQIPNGQKVDAALVEATDYAGNKLASPYEWSFITDRPQVTEADFEQLTTGGGHTPALSPDGSMLAFVSARSGQERVWVAKSNDIGEKASSAVQLTSGIDIQSDPAWSPDGKMIAYVSNASGSQQVWVAAPDGSNAHSVTVSTGGAASPTWLPDGTQILFVRDGNVWSVAPDGTGLRAATNYPERPIISVRAQPQGGQYIAVGFKLYEETVQLFDLAAGELQPVTHGGRDREPSWLNDSTLIYSAPAGQNQPDAIWRVGTDGAGSSVLPGSAQPGVADMEPEVSADGSVMAVTSTRGGERNVWVRQLSQVALLQIAPASGALPGQTITITYALPVSTTVNLSIVDQAGALVRSLMHDESKPKGTQQLTWDGTDESGKAVAPGIYTVKLSAKVDGGGELIRYATVRINDPVEHGTLHIEIQQWAGEPAKPDRSLQTFVYAQGKRDAPVAQASSTNSPSFDLPVGHYDVVVVDYVGEEHVVRDLGIEPSETTNKTIDLNLGALQVLMVAAPGQPVQAGASIAVSRSGDSTGSALQTAYSGNETFLLPMGTYDVRAEYNGVRKLARGLIVKSAQVTHSEINLDSGVVHITVYSKDGQLADAGGRVAVSAFDPKSHQLLGTSFDNPAELLLPTGRYDLRVDYSLRTPGFEPASLVGGSKSTWIPAVDVQAGETVTREYNLQLTPVSITVEEAQGKAPPEGALSFFIYPKGEHTAEIAAALTNTAHLELPEGLYDVVPTYNGVEHNGDVFTGLTFEVKYSQPTERTFNLGLGHAIIEVSDAQGQLVDKDQLMAAAYPAGQRDKVFSTQFGANPLDLPLLANTSYDLVVHLTDGRSYEIDRQQVQEGKRLDFELQARDFKP